MLNDTELEAGRGFDPAKRGQTEIPAKPAATPKRRRLFWVIPLVALAIGLVWIRQHRPAPSPPPGGPGATGRPGSFAVPVAAGTVQTQDFPVYLDGIGTVQAFNTVTVRSRVDGQVQKVLFSEGQDVKAGDLLVQIDPAPFQAQLDQCTAKKAQDEAQLAVAKLTLKRDAELRNQKILSEQDYDTQKALVDQLQATVQADQAAIDNARVQLDYTRIMSPLDGRVGLRLVDQGNIVHANDASGILVITQLRPISVLFTLPQKNLGQIQQRLRSGETLPVLAVDEGNRNTLDQGKLAVVDNQIDTTTGTIRLKATFPNDYLRLWPGQFVNARLLLTTRKAAIVVPTQVIQHGPEGATFAFVILPDSTVAMQPVKEGPSEQGLSVVEEGLEAGQTVVVDGQYKLQPGSQVKVGEPTGARAAGGGRGTGPSQPAGRSGGPGKSRGLTNTPMTAL